MMRLTKVCIGRRIPSRCIELVREQKFLELIRNNHQVIFCFYTDWSPPCKDIVKYFEDRSGIYSNTFFVKVHAEEYPGLAESLNIFAVPTFILFKDEKIVEKWTDSSERILKIILEEYNGCKQIPITSVTDLDQILTQPNIKTI
eukprot:NODE_10227_length_530_cov_47.415233_g9580_i0.p1 GENE.NODE_10227_length_530_cov_47.415233_g9580_i0~~NODE_10227_length_530_cov_47.415233_g9580_i0.p1  ORF type:complete len:144 (+),score=7.67 NODE_10227_length_530_cov_47.415233_g9580_i0:62-493(+)